MPANLWKSLTVRIMALGHSLHEAECIAAVIVLDCLVISTIMGYHFRDTERERSAAFLSGPETCTTTLAGHCGTVTDGVDRNGMLLRGQLDPARPDSHGERNGIADMWCIFSAVMRNTAMLCR